MMIMMLVMMIMMAIMVATIMFVRGHRCLHTECNFLFDFGMHNLEDYALKSPWARPSFTSDGSKHELNVFSHQLFKIKAHSYAKMRG